MSDQEPEQPAEFNPINDIQQTLARLDTDALVVGFATVVEWLEEDGSRALSVINTPMPPWHLHGLMTYARDHHCHGATEVAYIVDDDFGDDL